MSAEVDPIRSELCGRKVEVNVFKSRTQLTSKSSDPEKSKLDKSLDAIGVGEQKLNSSTKLDLRLYFTLPLPKGWQGSSPPPLLVDSEESTSTPCSMESALARLSSRGEDVGPLAASSST